MKAPPGEQNPYEFPSEEAWRIPRGQEAELEWSGIGGGWLWYDGAAALSTSFPQSEQARGWVGACVFAFRLNIYPRICCIKVCVGCSRIFRSMVLILTLTLLQTSLQQDPSHDGPGAEEHRRGSDVVKERADYDSSSEQEISSALSSVAQVLGSVRPKKARRHRQRLLLTTAKKLLVSLELFIRRATTTLSWRCIVISHAIVNGMKKSWLAPTKDVKTKKRRNQVHMSCFLAQTMVKEYTTTTPGKQRYV